jgi:hypothetical protein
VSPIRHLAVLLSLCALAAAAGDASAESFHEKADPRPITKGGDVIGMRLVLTLRPDGTQKTVLVGLGKPSNSYNSGNYRTFASDPTKGYLLHQWKQIELDGKNAKEVTLEVLFADVPGLKAGDDVDVVSAWQGSTVHVWGMKRSSVAGTQVKIPGARPPGAAAPPRTTARAARARVARRAAQQRQVRRIRTSARRGRR